MKVPTIYTVESVTCGHPDKMCDQISDAILDACLSQDPYSRVAVECFGSGDLLVIGGEITSHADVDYSAVARKVYSQVGYTNDLRIIEQVRKQSSDIAIGVDTGGAGDQGIMYGFATNETPQYLPKGVVLAHDLAHSLEFERKAGTDWLLPDGKVQVSMQEGKIVAILVSAQHREGQDAEYIRQWIIHRLNIPATKRMFKQWGGEHDYPVHMLVNPTVKFVQGGFVADTGLTGRKIMVDTYGGIVPHGGGAFSGKDASKVDRSAAYMARFAAKNLVSRGWANSCLVSVAYAIGVENPVMAIAVDENGVRVPIPEEFDFRPRAIIERLGLQCPIFQKTAVYGHFGKNELPWEQII